MTTPVDQNDASKAPASGYVTSWGPRLFWVVFALIMVFFWWLLIYSGGAVIHHG